MSVSCEASVYHQSSVSHGNEYLSVTSLICLDRRLSSLLQSYQKEFKDIIDEAKAEVQLGGRTIYVTDEILQNILISVLTAMMCEYIPFLECVNKIVRLYILQDLTFKESKGDFREYAVAIERATFIYRLVQHLPKRLPERLVSSDLTYTSLITGGPAGASEKYEELAKLQQLQTAGLELQKRHS